LAKSLGLHVLLEFHGCPSERLEKTAFVEKVLMDSALASGAHIVETLFHQFNPYGVSGVIVISESHFTIHTWPEHNYAAVDIFTCDEELDLEQAVKVLKEAFQPSSMQRVEMKRGIVEELPVPI